MTVLWIGHEVDCYLINAVNNIESNTVSDASQERAGMRVASAGAGELISTPDWAATNEIWHKFNWEATTTINNPFVIWAARDATGLNVAQIVTASATTAQFQVWNGATYTNIGAVFTIAVGVKYRFDVHFKGGASGVVECYFGPPGSQTLVANATGAYGSAINMVRVYHQGVQSASGNTWVAHEIVQTTSTLSSTSETKFPTSNGADLNGTGTWADVDEAIPYNDADVVTLGASGQHQSFKAAARTTTQAVVTGVTASCRAWYEAGGPTQLKPYLTIGGTRYYGTTFALQLTAQAYQYTWQTNPATGVAFTTAEANAATLEWGWEAV